MVTGATGFFGPYLMEQIGKDAVGVARKDADYCCDLTDKAKVMELMEMVKPSCIIHAAAMTDVNLCERTPDMAMSVNVLATRNIVQAMPKDCRIIYISTDMIYSGDYAPHKEFSVSESPLNQYGLSKSLGEFEAAKAKDWLILRTSMFGLAKTYRPSSLIDWLIDRFTGSEPVNLFNDVLFSPLWVGTLARMVTECAEKDRTGVFNLGSTHGMSKLRFGLLVASALKLPITMARSIESISLPNRTTRPLDTRMDISRAESMLGLTMPSLAGNIIEMVKGINEKSRTNVGNTAAIRH